MSFWVSDDFTENNLAEIVRSAGKSWAALWLLCVWWQSVPTPQQCMLPWLCRLALSFHVSTVLEWCACQTVVAQSSRHPKIDRSCGVCRKAVGQSSRHLQIKRSSWAFFVELISDFRSNVRCYRLPRVPQLKIWRSPQEWLMEHFMHKSPQLMHRLWGDRKQHSIQSSTNKHQMGRRICACMNLVTTIAMRQCSHVFRIERLVKVPTPVLWRRKILSHASYCTGKYLCWMMFLHGSLCL
jgi:hypothetical protein